MRAKLAVALLMLLAFLVVPIGCGPITAASVVKQGGMWVAKKVAKEGYEKLKEHHDYESDDHDSRSRRRERTVQQSPAPEQNATER